MKKSSLLTSFALLVFSLPSFGQSSQAKRYNIKYFKMYTEGEVTTSTPEKNEVILIDENASRIELKSGQGSQDRIFKIQRKGPDPVNKDCTIYRTTLPTNDRQGLACMVIVIDKFYKLIKMGDCATNQEGLKNYMEFQYE